MSSLANISRVLHNENENMTQDELDTIVTDIPDMTDEALSEWKTFEVEMKNEYLELIMSVEEEIFE